MVASVFDHVDLCAGDYAKSVRFYEAVLAPLGIPKIDQHPGSTLFTNLNVVDRRPATQNLHLCFYARSREQVDGFHGAGVRAGFRSNGAPRLRVAARTQRWLYSASVTCSPQLDSGRSSPGVASVMDR